MVESAKEYVLQWDGHAARVTERFSGLFARQALVDVTLICQGQKLRVHKLVLASCSLYFEEMLEQDLGQEPIILLRDLDFDVLKAMVEFMYCGETTISHCHLQALLDAAQVFMVKELECITKSMLKTERSITQVPSNPEDDEISSSETERRRASKMRPSGERFDDASLSSEESDDTSMCKSDKILEIERKSSYNQLEHSLYESMELATELPSNRPEDEEKYEEEEEEEGEEGERGSSENSEMSDEDNNAEEEEEEEEEEDVMKGKDDLKCMLNDINLSKNCYDDYQQDISSIVGECSKVYTHKKRKRKYTEDSRETSVSPTESSSPEDNINGEISECQNNRKKCLKVYTHKRRDKSLERNNSRCSSISDCYVSDQTSTACIDLIDENPPVTLASSLDMETSEYIWNLSSDSIQYVVGCTINQGNTTINVKDPNFTDKRNDLKRKNDTPIMNKRVRHIKELFDVGNTSLNYAPPVLRRSVRINQLENDDSLNNNAANVVLNASKGRNKHAEKRKTAKNLDCRIADENNATATTIRHKYRNDTNNSRSLRSGKFSSSKSTKTRNYKNESKSHNNEEIKKTDNSDGFVHNRLNTIASVDRALWGDMSDLLDNPRDDITIADYSPSKEIPFAVGLLPLRAALERMQATIDHQPRKTRSSVAPLRQDNNGFKRKDNESINNTTSRNKQNNDDHPIANTVCHIQIHTSSPCTENRKNSNDEQIIAICSTSENNRR